MDKLDPEARFTNECSPEIQIRWNIQIAGIRIFAITSLHIFTRATVAKLWWHGQHFVTITLLESREEQNEISMVFELWWKKH